jgi:hypothetical protein
VVDVSEIASIDSKIMMVENFLNAETCQFFEDYAKRTQKVRVGVVHHNPLAPSPVITKDDIGTRDARRVVPDTLMYDKINNMLARAFIERVEPFYGVEVESWENPQLLYYTKGGKYGAHNDGEEWHQNSDGTGEWKRILDRDISVLVYLNDEFTGGLLHFPRHKIKIRPKPGLLVAFPSGGEYQHAAEPTESGERFAIVSWSEIAGSPRVQDPNRGGRLFMSRFRKQHTDTGE